MSESNVQHVEGIARLNGPWIESPLRRSRLIALAIMMICLIAMAVIAVPGSNGLPGITY